MEVSFSLADAFAETFGYRSAAFEPNISAIQGVEVGKRLETAKTGAPYYVNDLLGREYFMPVKVQYTPEAALPDGVFALPNVSFYLPYPVMRIDAGKIVKETFLTDRGGFFTEYIAPGPWEITIRGLMIDKGNDFPESDFAQILELWRQNSAISIQNPVTDLLLLQADRKGSDKVIITRISFPERQGVKHVKGYELQMRSDSDFILDIID